MPEQLTYPQNVELPRRQYPPTGKRFIAKGHDSQLQDAQYSGAKTTLNLMSGISVTGKLLRRDKYTITLLHEKGEEIFYKHAIEGVLISAPTNAG